MRFSGKRFYQAPPRRRRSQDATCRDLNFFSFVSAVSRGARSRSLALHPKTFDDANAQSLLLGPRGTLRRAGVCEFFFVVSQEFLCEDPFGARDGLCLGPRGGRRAERFRCARKTTALQPAPWRAFFGEFFFFRNFSR